MGVSGSGSESGGKSKGRGKFSFWHILFTRFQCKELVLPFGGWCRQSPSQAALPQAPGGWQRFNHQCPENFAQTGFQLFKHLALKKLFQTLQILR